ncbi:2-oxoglutarate and oxygenase superfamily protein [Perilla frutescens var. hirtella]|nr:2-oxoglutarate and oxygenase superfamily protein [Perilla frutescens var. hirtella]KAH6811150.1 2-oxoglutarate and oxygenase superfamily protein [Perilla frutescens var. frutescens]
MEEEEMKAVLREAFGDSSSDSDGEPSTGLRRRVGISDSSDEIARPLSIFGDSHIWEQITEINGLWICRDFLSADQQSSLLSALEKDGYLAEASHNQAMRFGDLPPWALELSHLIRENVCFSSDFPVASENQCLFPSELLWREPLFNQLIVNMYQPGEGIGAHVDLMRFEDGIAIISLESPCVMHFSSSSEGGRFKIPLLLSPGSLVLMWGEARYLWKHEINRHPGFQIWEGKQLDQKRRTSVTLRALSQTEQ